MKRRIIAWVLIAVLVFSAVCQGNLLSVRAWFTPEEEKMSSLDIALEQFTEYEYRNEDSTYNTIIRDLQEEYDELVEKMQFAFLPDVYASADQFRELIGLVKDFRELYQNAQELYSEFARNNEHDHELMERLTDAILVYDYLAKVYDFIAEMLGFIDDSEITESTLELYGICIQLLRYALDYGRDFMLMPEYIDWANDFNPWWMILMDLIIRCGPQTEYDHVGPIWYPVRIPPGANSLKPNIYLYGPEGTEFTVTFCEPDLLTAVLPAYDGSWQVALENGRLTVAGAAGYEFLFYESLTSPALMQTDAGYVIEPETRTEQFERILRQTGFAENEIADFLEYWTDKLEPNTTYVMYPQDTQAVDIAMPITVEGATIESYCRIWYYFVPYTGQSVAEPEIEPVQHEGITLIEWGGVLDE